MPKLRRLGVAMPTVQRGTIHSYLEIDEFIDGNILH